MITCVHLALALRGCVVPVQAARLQVSRSAEAEAIFSCSRGGKEFGNAEGSCQSHLEASARPWSCQRAAASPTLCAAPSEAPELGSPGSLQTVMIQCADVFGDRADAPVLERPQTRTQLHSQGGPVCLYVYISIYIYIYFFVFFLYMQKPAGQIDRERTVAWDGNCWFAPVRDVRLYSFRASWGTKLLFCIYNSSLSINN